MATNAYRPKRNLADVLQSVPKQILYLLLVLCTSIPLFVKVAVPNEPSPASRDFYQNLLALPDGSRILLGSDWTNSTRGESSGAMTTFLKIAMRKRFKLAVYCIAGADCPQVFRDLILRVSQQEVAAGRKGFTPFEDYVMLGYFPNGEGTLLSINNDITKAFAGKKDFPLNSNPRDVMQSPVFKGVKSVTDFAYLIDITGSNTSTSTIERVKKVPLMFMVTGVMVPETLNFYSSGQIKGMVGGVKGVYDMETLMDKDFPGQGNNGMGTAYYLSLHFAVGLLILAVIVGNVAMFLGRRGGAK